MSAPYILYGGGVTRSIAVQLLLEEAGLPYELRPVDIRTGEYRQPAFLAINPAGFVPALVTPEGEVMHETAAMLLYFAERHGLTGMAPPPGDPDLARFLCQLFYLTNDIQPAIKQFVYAHRYTTDDNVAASREAARRMALDRWAVLDRYLGDNGPLHLGVRFSLLDLHMTVWALYGFEKTTDITDAFPAVKGVVEAVRARPQCAPLLDAFEAEVISFLEARKPS